jgi:hypothetical protein
MGGKKPDNSEQMAELKRQREEADAAAQRLAEQNLSEVNARRQRRRGKSLLIGTSELGVSDKLGQ